ncbi:N-acetylglucosamine-6-phosphate deacetylase [Pseudoteredinibacter isoporae]|uniref:N-acetylglucosamine-6-phosphate deacetylase n=1 Tax=Pseudoteredinibacter isoporae TaxID=570281 RepID=UPI0031055F6B
MAKNDPIRAILCQEIFDGERRHSHAALLVSGSSILGIKPQSQLNGDETLIDFGDRLLAPGLIDIQVNGGGDTLFNNQPTLEGLIRIAKAHRRFGTTRIMPTIISDVKTVRQQAAQAVNDAQDARISEILGLHLEGPFFANRKRGAHKADFIRDIQPDDVQELIQIAKKMRLMSTLAPETTKPGMVRELHQHNVRVWAGHSNASYQQTLDALAEGVCGFTHIFNAMSPLQAREPGVVGAALEHQDSYCGLIADGHHVHPSNIALLLRSKAPGKVVLVSDAMATIGGSQAAFELYGEPLSVKDKKLINAEGKLAGSAIALIDAVRVMSENNLVDLDEALRMASLYPAQSLGVDNTLGYLKTGYSADFVCLDKHLHVHASGCAGNILINSIIRGKTG